MKTPEFFWESSLEENRTNLDVKNSPGTDFEANLGKRIQEYENSASARISSQGLEGPKFQNRPKKDTVENFGPSLERANETTPSSENDGVLESKAKIEERANPLLSKGQPSHSRLNSYWTASKATFKDKGVLLGYGTATVGFGVSGLVSILGEARVGLALSIGPIIVLLGSLRLHFQVMRRHLNQMS